jgi:hypothetical protein
VISEWRMPLNSLLPLRLKVGHTLFSGYRIGLVKKIIIRTDKPERYRLLASLIRRTFPESELVIVPKTTVLSEEERSKNSHLTPSDNGRNHDPHHDHS